MSKIKVETILSKNISSAGPKSSYDAACKKLLANKVILAWIMKSCLDEYKDYEIQEIADKFIEGEPQISKILVTPDEVHSEKTEKEEKIENKTGNKTKEKTDSANSNITEKTSDSEQIIGMSTEDKTIHEGTISYDIRFYASVPVSGDFIRLIINVEAQNKFHTGYPIVKRGLYYCSRMISSQYGTEFVDSHYEKIKKVYSIWICMNPPEKRKNTINRYSIKEEQFIGNAVEPPEHYDLMTTIIICLGDSDNNSSGILRLLEVLLSSEREAEEKKRILQDDFAIKMTRELESEVSIMCNLSSGIEEKGIEKGIKIGTELGREEGRKEGREEGRKEGKEEGREEGREEGIKISTLQSITNLMESLNFTAEQAMEALKLSFLEKEKYSALLKQQS